MKGLRTILKGLSLTTALFVFQACYGTPYGYDEYGVSFKVISAETGKPLEGVDIQSRPANYADCDWNFCATTDETGYAGGFIGLRDFESPEFLFTLEGSEYAVKDTIITDFKARMIVIELEKAQ